MPGTEAGVGTSRLPKAVALVLALLSPSALGLAAWWYYGRAHGVPITELELAGTAARAKEVVAGDPARFVRAVDADRVLIAGYAAAIVIAAELGRQVFWTPRARFAARVALWAGIAAAAADAVENVLLRDALTRPTPGDRQWIWAQAVAFTKFGLLAVAAPVALTAVAFTLGRLLARIRRPERYADSFLRPPAPLPPDPDAPLPPVPAGATRAPAPARWDAAGTLPPGREPGRVGICASGGGIRSACVTLGALQSLRAAGELQRADYLVSVSGGGYAAGAFQLALQPRPDSADPDAADPDAADPDAADPDAADPDAVDPNAADPATVLRPGSVEEDHLRRHGRYIADDARQWLVALVGVFRGLVVSLALVTLTVVVAGLALGLFYRWVPVAGLNQKRPALTDAAVATERPDLRPQLRLETGVLLAVGVVAAAALLLYVLVVVGQLWFGGSRSWGRLLRVVTALGRGLGGMAGVLGLLGVGIPALVWLTADLAYRIGAGPLVTPIRGGVVTVALAYGATLAGLLWRSRRVIGAGVGSLRGLLRPKATGPGTAAAVPTGWLQGLIVRLVLLLMVVVLLLVLGLVVGVTDSWSVTAQGIVVGAFVLAVLLLDQTWLSLHPFYRQRLASAFAVRRVTGTDGRPVAAGYDFAGETTTLSRYGRRVPGFPQVIFAAAANLGGDERTPPGRRAVSFTLADDWIGGPDVGWVRTAEVEQRVRGQLRRDLTVEAAVAISGAAFASAMGRQARAYQTFFALSGARLGTWLPNPTFLWAIRVSGQRGDGPDWRAPRLPRLRRLPYLFREVLGSYALDDRLLLCTDGGHYENLGLVELLRHRCRLVYCIDASGDAPPFATTLAEAISLAYEELGVEILLGDAADALIPGRNGTPLPPGDPLAPLAARMSRSGVVVGRIRYPEPVRWDGVAEPSRDAILVVAKASLAQDLPYELKAYAAANPVFPRDSTGDQWFDHGQFDAYQGLGRFLGRCAAGAGVTAEQGLDRTASWWRRVPRPGQERV